MASFVERVLIKIEADAKGVKSELGNLKSAVKDAEGGMGKMKAAASGLGNVVSSAMSPTALAAGATALGTAAVKAVGDFTKLALTVGKVRDATGLSAEAASRWVEVADDAGVSAETFTSIVGKLEKNLGTNKEAFAAWGVEVATAKDGTVDMNQTLLNAIDVINAISDPIEKQKAGLAIFGKSWSSMSELIGRGSAQLRQDLDSVQLSKVFSDADIDKGRDVRDAMDAISDAVEGLSLSLGKALAPAVAKIAPKLAEMIAKAEPAIEQLGDDFTDLADAVLPVIDVVSDLNDALHTLHLDAGALSFLSSGLDSVGLSLSDLSLGAIPAATQAWDSLTGVELDGHAALEGTTERLDDEKQASDDAAAATAQHAKEAKEAKASNEAYAKALQAVHDGLVADKEAQQALTDGMRAAADAGFAVDKATQDWNQTNKDLSDNLKEAGKDTVAHKVAIDAVVESATALADAQQRQMEDLISASGATATATEKLDAWNDSMLRQAKSAAPAAKDAIVDYIGQVNGIPAEKLTDIKAAIARGDLDEASRLLDEASKSRTATVKADADDASLATVDRQLDDVAKTRTVNFHAGSVKIFGKGGTVGPEGGIGGEAGPEFIELPDGRRLLLTGPTPVPAGTKVTSTSRTRQLLRGHVPRYANGTRSQPSFTAAAKVALDTRTVERQIAQLLRARPLRLQAQVVPTTTLVRVNGGG